MRNLGRLVGGFAICGLVANNLALAAVTCQMTHVTTPTGTVDQKVCVDNGVPTDFGPSGPGGPTSGGGNNTGGGASTTPTVSTPTVTQSQIATCAI